MKPEAIIRTGSEFEHQSALYAWAALNKTKYPELELLFAIKNEEKSGSAYVGSKFKASGVKKGVHDNFLSVPKIGLTLNGILFCFNGLYIEMKRPGGKPSDEQLAFGKMVEARGYAWTVCDHWEKARDEIVDYLEGGFQQKIHLGVKHRK